MLGGGKLIADLNQRLAQAENILAALDRSQAVIEFDPDGTVLTANQNFTNTVGYALAEIVGRHHRQFVSAEDAASSDYHAFWSDLRAGRFRAGKYCRIAKGGRPIWIQATYNPVLDNAGRVVKVIKYAVDITQAETAAEAARAAKAASDAEQAETVSMLGARLADLARGDLTVRLDHALAGTYDQLRLDFNSATEALRATLSAVAESATSLRTGSDEIAMAADDLSRRTEQQAASLEQTAAALDQITATVTRSSEGALKVADVVSGAREDATRSGQIVANAVQAMGLIERSSSEISQIIGVIDEIAFQTNLLALNAGVEAARAGEAGRGFAVVAQEVRALAQRSAEAAKQIKGLISASSTQVGSGVQLVGQTGEALARIVGKVAEIDTLIAEIARSSREQATGLAQVNLAVNQMDQVTQQNAAMVEQATAAASNLRNDSAELARRVERFQIGAAARSGRQRAA